MARNRSIRAITSIYPSRKTERRIKIPQPTWRPISIRARDVVRSEFVSQDPLWFITHRRGLKRPLVGIDPLEARATPKEKLRGTLPERILYKALVTLMHMKPELDFSFQSCVARHHKVLTSDLRWVEAGSLKEGDQLLSFEEYGNPNRAWKIGTVIHNHIEIMPAFIVTLSNGQKIITTPEHPWLIHYAPNKHDWSRHTGYAWVETRHLKIGAHIPRFFNTWMPNQSYEAGWLAGFFDGEGSVVHHKTQTGGHALSVTITQNAGRIFDRFCQFTKDLGFNISIYDYRDKYKRSYDNEMRQAVHGRIMGGRNEALRFLGTIRPEKLSRLDVTRLGKMEKIEQAQVVSIEPAGECHIARLEVDTHTYVVEGFGMHNSMQGGRMELGGIVADFMFPYLKLIIQVQGPTHTGFLRHAKDEEQKGALEEMGFRVVDVDLDVIYNEAWFENWIRRLFGLTASGGGSGVVYSPYGGDGESPIDWSGPYAIALEIADNLHTIMRI